MDLLAALTEFNLNIWIWQKSWCSITYHNQYYNNMISSLRFDTALNWHLSHKSFLEIRWCHFDLKTVKLLITVPEVTFITILRDIITTILYQ